MKANRLSGLLLFLIFIATVFRLSAQPGEADAKRFEDTKAKAEKGDAIAQWSLGTAYHKGDGVAKDDAEAVKWWRKAAEQNDADTQYNLGLSYASGIGVATNYIEAHKWLYLAAAQGDEGAKVKLRLLDLKMTPEQIDKGQQLAREFKSRKE